MTSTLPNLVIAGVRKGGTTSLANYLAQHPDICSSELKKVGYFLPLKYGQAVPDIADYAAHFAHATDERYRMEATTGYFLGGSAIADPLAVALPDARVVISLREPVDALWSHYRFVRSHLRIEQDLDFEGYVARSRAMMESGEDLLRENNAYVAFRGGFYDGPLTEWIDALGDRLRIVYFDDLQSDAKAMVVGLCQWLDIDIDVIDDFDFDVHNKSVQVKNTTLQHLALRLNESTKRFFRKHHGLKRTLRDAYYRVNQDRGPSPKLDPKFRELLTAEYAASVARTVQLLDEHGVSGTLPRWLRSPGQP